MKPATPILRNEHYLDVMTGGSASLPSPILREERYLAKLAGMEVNIPNPVTIKEKYYAKICGMDVDVPTYTRNMPRIYAYMAKAAGQTIEDLPTAVTREQRYWFDYVSEPPVTEHEYTGTVPYTFTANGEPLLDWYIKGNMQQSGTPSPTTPIQPQECGERTGNLFDGELKQGSVAESGSVGTGYNNVTDYQSTKRVVTSNPVVCHGATVTWDNSKYWICICYFDKNLGYIGNTSQGFETWITTGVHEMHKYPYAAIAVRRTDNADFTPEDASDLNLVVDTYKIPISSASTTTPVYLGEVESTRKVKKLVLTGEETIRLQSINEYNIANFYINIASVAKDGLSSHLEKQNTIISQTQTEGFLLSVLGASTTLYMRISTSRASTTTELQTWLSNQYTNGTPVTFWYTTEDTTTGIVNEPLRKIGDYADSISMEQAGVNIPTNNGSTTIDVETTLKPSEVYIKWKGAAT